MTRATSDQSWVRGAAFDTREQAVKAVEHVGLIVRPWPSQISCIETVILHPCGLALGNIVEFGGGFTCQWEDMR